LLPGEPKFMIGEVWLRGFQLFLFKSSTHRARYRAAFWALYLKLLVLSRCNHVEVSKIYPKAASEQFIAHW